MSEPLQRLREENEQLRALLAARTSERNTLQAAIESIRTKHEAMAIRLTTEILVLKRQLFDPKAERIKNAEAQQSLFDILKDMGRLQAGDISAGERADAMLGELREESDPAKSDEGSSKRLPPKTKRKGKSARRTGARS